MTQILRLKCLSGIAISSIAVVNQIRPYGMLGFYEIQRRSRSESVVSGISGFLSFQRNLD